MGVSIGLNDTPQIDLFAPADVKNAQTLDLYPPAVTPKLDDNVVAQRAAKFSFAMGDHPDYPDQDTIGINISAGNEKYFRDLAVAKSERQQMDHRTDLMKAYVDHVGDGPVTPENAQTYKNLGTKTPLNPDSVIEENYGRRLINTATTADPGEHNSLRGALNEDPHKALDIADQASWAIARKEITQKLSEENDARIKNSSLIGKAGDFLETMLPGLSNYRRHGVIQGEDVNHSILPGSEFASQKLHLLNLPPAQYQVELKKAYDEIAKHNLFDAGQFLREMQDYSTSDKFLSNAFGVADIASVIPGGTILKGLGKAAEGFRAVRATGVAKEAVTAASEAVRAQEGVSKVVASPEVTLRRADFVAKDGMSVNLANAGDSLAKTVDAALASGRKVQYFIEGKARDIVSVEKGSLRDSKGQPWGIGPLLQPLPGNDDRIVIGASKAVPTFVPNPVESAAVKDFAKTAKDVVQEAGRSKTDAVDIAASTGNFDAAAKLDILKQAKKGVFDKDVDGSARDLLRRTMSLNDPEFINKGSSQLAGEHLNRIAEELKVQSSKLLRSLSEPTMVTRLPDDALLAAYLDAAKTVTKRFDHLGDAVLNIEPVNFEKALTNTAAVQVSIGKPDGTLFKSGQRAAVTAKKYGLPDGSYQIASKGDGHYITLLKDVDETTGEVRDHLIPLENKNPVSLANAIIGFARTADDTVAPLQRANRHAATTANQILNSNIADVGKSITSLSNGQLNDFDRVLTVGRDTKRIIVKPNGDQEIVRGKWFKTPGELENVYRSELGRYPSEKEVKAYFTYQQLSDLDYVLRVLGIHRDKVRQGIEKVRFLTKEVDAQGQIKRTQTPFEGKFVEKLPDNGDIDAGVIHYDNATGKADYVRTKNLTPEKRELWKKDIEENGYRIVQVANPFTKPLAKPLGVDETANFVIIKDFDVQKLKLTDHIPYREGGHVDYAKDQFYTKQAKITKTSYGTHEHEGDVSIFAHPTEAEAKQHSASVEKARQLMNAGDDQSLADHLSRTLPWDSKEFKSLFEPVINAKGDVEELPRLQKNVPISYVGNAKGLNDKYRNFYAEKYEGYDDVTDSPYNLYKQINKKFTGQRGEDLDSIANVGTEKNPVYNVVKPRILNPLSSMNDSMANAMRSRHMDDYKISATEAWLKQYADLMRIPFKEIMKDPERHLRTPQWQNIGTMSPSEMKDLMSAKASRLAILNLLGTPGVVRKGVDMMRSKLLDATYSNRFAGKGVSDFLADHTLGTNADPLKVMRNIAYHAKIGIFSPVQVPLQAQALAVMSAILPTHAIPSLLRTSLFNAIKMAPQHLDHIAGIGRKLGLDVEHTVDAWNQMKKTGYDLVGGESAWADNYLDPKIFKGTLGTALDYGTVFFRQGEQQVRYNSWNLAYREWRKANPYAEMTDKARNGVLARANDLAGNMTRASNAPWQNGITANTTQFWAYQARMMDLMWGKRLSIGERARAFAMNSLLYGVPVGLGAFEGVAPAYESIKKYMLENHIDTSSGLPEFLMEGAPAMALEAITGKKYEVGKRFGPNGITTIKDALRGKLGVPEMLMGASGTIVEDIVSSSSSFMKGVYNLFSEDKDKYPLLPEDFLSAVRNISSVNSAVKGIMAANIGRYVTQGQVPISDTDGWDALIMSLTGMESRGVSDMGLRIENAQDLKAVQDAATKDIVKYGRLALDHSDKPEEFDKYHRAMMASVKAAGFTPDQYAKLLQKITGGSANLSDKVLWDTDVAHPSADQVDEGLDEFMNKDGNQ